MFNIVVFVFDIEEKRKRFHILHYTLQYVQLSWCPFTEICSSLHYDIAKLVITYFELKCLFKCRIYWMECRIMLEACTNVLTYDSVNEAITGFVRSWKTWKSHGILKPHFPGLEKFWKKWINPESFGKVMEIYFTNLCIIQLCLFGSWISVRDCAWAISHISTLSRSFRI